MKAEAISNRDRGRIVGLVSATGAWKGTRLGYRVKISDSKRTIGQPSLFDSISWGVCIKRRWQGGTERTVSEAVQEINRVISFAKLKNMAARRAQKPQETLAAAGGC